MTIFKSWSATHLGLIQPDHFKLLCELVATDIMLTQSSSKPDLDAPTIKKKLERFLRGTGTAAENMDVDALYIRIRSKISEFVTASLTNNVELRRQLWLSDTNFNVWFDSWKDVLVNLGFAKDEPMMDDEGNVISEVTLLPSRSRSRQLCHVAGRSASSRSVLPTANHRNSFGTVFSRPKIVSRRQQTISTTRLLPQACPY